ncbi:malto-oligosyltrehalose synthase [Georgenia sp. Z1491]|uniref:malto-oligosyltrehalose synthase n=1 Tax=Georgenia sp. Z1491 TaxID=3416707 RepID=UPI003CF326CA
MTTHHEANDTSATDHPATDRSAVEATTRAAAAAHLPGPGRRTPVSTYRLQLGPDLTFDDVGRQLDHLSNLGVTDVYLSPVLTAAPGSTHGYDVVDHTTISATLGGRDGLERLARAAHELDMGVVVDLVPNHMAVPTPAWHNRALWSVLALGPDSPYASWFDVDLSEGGGGVLMPVLGRRIGAALADGEIELTTAVVPGEEDAGEQHVLTYYDHVLPVRAGTEQLPLADLLDRQFYRLAYWKVADEELNYRRFFDVGSLAAIRVEDEAVFDATHGLLLTLLHDGVIDALRVDHPDGLADPRGYFRRLHEATGGAWVVAEKILEDDEDLPGDWQVAGTTGYDAAWRLHGIQVDPAGLPTTGALMQQIAGDAPGDYESVRDAAKRQIVEGSLYAEVHRLATLLSDVCDDDVRLRDHSFRPLLECVRELVIAVHRYRAYVVPGEPAPPESEAFVEDAAATARTRLDADRHETLDVVVDLVLGREVGSAGRTREARRDEIIVRFQQVCGAVTAKGVEDTTFYRWTHLLSLNEVGGAPQRGSLSVDELHAWAGRTQTFWPATMTNGSTHDTKRSEDVRARIGVISEHAAAWRSLVADLRELTAERRPADLDGRTENLVWQTLAGTWGPDGPIEAVRLTDYLLKAVREQKTWTTWTDQDAAGEEELTAWVAAMTAEPAVRERFAGWVADTAHSLRTSVLGTKALQLTLVGVADVYQGTELLTDSLVDPDNRRPVDHGAIAATLAELDAGRTPGDLGEEKLALTAAVLRLRRRVPNAFVGERSGYAPLPTTTQHAVALTRTMDGEPRAVTVATRLAEGLRALGGFHEHTVVLPPGTWTDVLTGTRHEGGATLLAELLAHRPVAVLEASA